MTTKIDWKLLQAQILLHLVKEHRAQCNGCSIPLHPLRDLYKSLIDRELNKDEEVFF